LTCSPSLAALSADTVVNLYRQRMRIEQEFRDTKNAALGAGLARSGSRGAKRLQALLLIGHLALLVLRLIGEAAKAQQMQLRLMSTHRTDRAELSVITLGRRVLLRPALRRQLPNPWPYRHRLRQQVAAAFQPTPLPA
jgi:Transposase DDE domain